jgi:hypothetical protein
MKQILKFIVLLFLISCAKAPTVEPEKTISMSQAMQIGEPVECSFEQEDQTVTIYMKGSMMRMDTTPADAHAIYTEDTMYTWVADQGNMVKMSEMKKLASQLGEQYQPKTQEEIVAAAEEKGIKCTAAQVSTDMFSPPDDVTFQDMTEIMNQMSERMKAQK